MTEIHDPDFALDTMLVPVDAAAEQDRRRIFAIARHLARHHGARLEFLLDTARALDASPILIHARRPGLQSFALGSIASRVANHAPCSVYVVRD